MLIFVVFVVGVKGFEPSTPCSQSRCANRTALRPDTSLLEKRGTKVLLLAGICKFCVWKFLKIVRNTAEFGEIHTLTCTNRFKVLPNQRQRVLWLA